MLTLQVVTPAGGTDLYDEDAYCLSQSQDMQTVIVRLPQDKGLYAQVQHILQTELYFFQHSDEGSTHIKRMRQQINDDKEQREKELVRHMEQLLCQAEVFAGGEKRSVERQSVKALCESALSSLVQAVYSKLDLIGRHYASEAEVDAVFGSQQQLNALPEHDGNAAARASMQDWCHEQQELRGQVIVLDTLLNRFSDRPFGWAELDILGLLAELVSAGKLELLQNQERLNPGKGLTRQLSSGSGRKSIVVRLQRQVSAAVLQTAREVYKDSAEGKSAASDPEALFLQYQQLLSQQLLVLQDYANRSQAAYPFHGELLRFLKLVQQLKGLSTHQDLFETLHERLDDYEDYLDAQSDLHSFYTHQCQVFDKHTAQLAAMAPEMVHVQDETLHNNYRKAEAIMHTADASLLKQMPQVSLLLQPVQQHLADLRQQHQSQVHSAIDQSLASLKATYADDADSLSHYWSQWQDLHNEVDAAPSIDSMVARKARIEALEQQVHQHIAHQAALAQQAAASANPAEAAPVAPVSKPVAIVHPVQLAPTPLIESEEDVQRYLDALGIALRKHLREDKRVQLK